MKVEDKVRYYINHKQYIAGVIVEDCGDGTYWVEHSNGQQRRYAECDLSLDD